MRTFSIFTVLQRYVIYAYNHILYPYNIQLVYCKNWVPSTAQIGDLYLKGVRSVAVMWTLNVCSVCFCQWCGRNIYCTKNGHEILCTDDIITAMNVAVNLDSVNPHH